MGEFRGSIQGDVCKKYAGFTYLKPIKKNYTFRDYDPDRLDPYNEFPRDCYPPTNNEIDAIEILDYVIRFSESGGWMKKVQVFVVPSKYSEIKNQELIVFELFVDRRISEKDAAKEALDRAFME